METMATLAVSMPASSCRRGRRQRAEQTGRLGRRRGHDDRVGLQLAAVRTGADGQHEAGCAASNGPDRGRGFNGERAPFDQGRGQTAQTTQHRREHRRRSRRRGGQLRGWLGARPASSDPPSVSAWARAGTVACRDSRSARPAYTPPSSGSTSRSTTSGPNRSETSRPTAMSSVIGANSASSSAAIRANVVSENRPAARAALEIAGHSHHRPGRDRTQPARRPDPRRAGQRRHASVPEPGRVDQFQTLGPAREHGFRADIDRMPGQGRGTQLAPDRRALLQHHDVDVRPEPRDLERRGEPGHSPADDGYQHIVTPRRGCGRARRRR